ncbi:tripartite tricarboxylate transporter substrate binding protein [Enterovirga aerilata]|uniref:Tripartite tricarboxylate transporter substrate binding protein n=1 Tax=Enterovirga aerilata TaxID=2730920 RepID=A0A849I8V3_9HYPH|nr:tripartite tricarboxylate transporter substrate binding protein [Enterovirga sp. DB1703]NNM72839.1 tripartite tricarboxylate transporter substrate binding protein [Enterovirga sp. DB1703]
MAKLTRRGALACGAAALLCGPALAQQGGRTMRLVVPFPPGGSTDALARMLQARLQDMLGQTTIVENMPGAASALGAAHVAKSAPDGMTLLVTFDSHTVIPAMVPNPPLDIERDLVPVSLVGTAPYVVATNRDKPYRTFADVLAAAKARPRAVTYASVGIGTIGHLAMTLLAKRAGVEITHVPYRGGGPAMNDLLGGHVELLCGSIALVAPQLGGQVRTVMQMGAQRLPMLKDTPTAIESGFDGFEALAWWGVFAPAATPADTLARLSAAVREALSERQIATKLQESQQMTLLLTDSAAAIPFFARQTKLWGDVVRENNIKA